jgi:hypothetical protein
MMNEISTITQVVQVKGNGYLFIFANGTPFEDTYEALRLLEEDNRAKQAMIAEEAEKQKLQQEMKDATAEAKQD